MNNAGFTYKYSTTVVDNKGVFKKTEKFIEYI